MLAGITFLSSLFSSAQKMHLSADEMLRMHNETMDDSYLPNAYDNKKTSPGYQYKSNGKEKSTGAGRVMSTSIYTIQVNVNGSGQNIIGDAANEPNIAVNPAHPNKVVIGWRQFDNVNSNFRQAGWSYTANSGLTWIFPGVINPGLFRSDPVLDYDTAGNFYYNSLQYNFTTQVFKSTNGGATWDAGTNAGGGDKQWMTIDRTSGTGSGNIYSAWNESYSTCLPGFFTRSENHDTSYENCTMADGSPFWETMAVGNSGELYIAGGDTLNDSLVVSKSTNAMIHNSTISWNTPVYVNMDGYLNGYSINPQGLLGQANIDVDRSNGPGRGNVYVLASVTRLSNSDPADVMFAKSTDGGLTWSSPIRINDDASTFNTQWFGTMSVAPNGRIDVIWLDTRDAVTGSDSSALYYSYSTDQGNTWSVNEKMSPSFDPHVGYPNQNKMGDYFDMVSDNTGAHLAWANTLNGEEDVYYSHIIPQIATGVIEIADNSILSIFPNPNNGKFVVSVEAKHSQIEIYNALGEKVFSKAIVKAKNEIDISQMPAGIYFLKIVAQDGSSQVKKIIRE